MQFRPEPDIRFFKINEIGGLKAWIERPMMAVFYGYQPNSMSDESSFKPMASYIPGFYLSSTTILGPIRLRQLRVKANSCLDTVRAVSISAWNLGNAAVCASALGMDLLMTKYIPNTQTLCSFILIWSIPC